MSDEQLKSQHLWKAIENASNDQWLGKALLDDIKRLRARIAELEAAPCVEMTPRRAIVLKNVANLCVATVGYGDVWLEAAEELRAMLDEMEASNE